jgi:hypothetical protein
MKTIAIITSVFFPGTYVATLFSMSMFSWQPFQSSSGSPTTTHPAGTISLAFWIYWAVSIPLTLVVLTTWAIWLQYRDRVRRRQIREMTAGLEKATSRAGPRDEARKTLYRAKLGVRRFLA